MEVIPTSIKELLAISKKDALKFIISVLKYKSFNVELDGIGSYTSIAEGTYSLIADFLKFDKDNPLTSKFGEKIYFVPDDRLVKANGYFIACIKYASHFSTKYVDYKCKNRCYDNTKSNGIILLLDSILKAEERLIDPKDDDRAYYTKRYYVKNVRQTYVIVFKPSKYGGLDCVTIMPDKHATWSYEKKKGKKMLASLPSISLLQNPANTDTQVSGISSVAIEYTNTTSHYTNVQQNTESTKNITENTQNTENQMNKNLKEGIEIEKEHKNLYIELKKRLEADGVKMPMTEPEFFTWIAKAHIEENSDYYSLLKKYVEKETNTMNDNNNLKTGGPIAVFQEKDSTGNFVGNKIYYYETKNPKWWAISVGNPLQKINEYGEGTGQWKNRNQYPDVKALQDYHKHDNIYLIDNSMKAGGSITNETMETNTQPTKYRYLDILTDTPERHEQSIKDFKGKRHFYLVTKVLQPDQHMAPPHNTHYRYWVDSMIGELGGESTGSFSVMEPTVELYTPTREELNKLINRYERLSNVTFGPSSSNKEHRDILNGLEEKYVDILNPDLKHKKMPTQTQKFEELKNYIAGLPGFTPIQPKLTAITGAWSAHYSYNGCDVDITFGNPEHNKIENNKLQINVTKNYSSGYGASRQFAYWVTQLHYSSELVVDAIKEACGEITAESDAKITESFSVQKTNLQDILAKNPKPDKRTRSAMSALLNEMWNVVSYKPTFYPEFAALVLTLPSDLKFNINPYDKHDGNDEVVAWLKDNHKNVLDYLPVEEYSLPKYKPFETLPDDKTFMTIHGKFTGDDEVRVKLLGTNFNKYGAVTTDASQMLFTKYNSEEHVKTGNYCHTKKCFNQEEAVETAGYPDWAAVIPNDNRVKWHLNTHALINFLSNVINLGLTGNYNSLIALKGDSDSDIIAFDSKRLKESVEALVKLGHSDLEMSWSGPNRAALIYPKGNAGKIVSTASKKVFDTDFVLLMPLLLENFSDAPVYYNIETNCAKFTETDVPYCFDITVVEKKKREAETEALKQQLESSKAEISTLKSAQSSTEAKIQADRERVAAEKAADLQAKEDARKLQLENEKLEKIAGLARNITTKKKAQNAIKEARAFTSEQIAETIAGNEIVMEGMADGPEKQALRDYTEGLRVMIDEEYLYAKGGWIKRIFGKKESEPRTEFKLEIFDKGKLHNTMLFPNDTQAKRVSEDMKSIGYTTSISEVPYVYAKGGGIQDNIMNERTRAVIVKLQKTKADLEYISPNYVADIAADMNVHLSSEEIVYISDNYGEKFEKGGNIIGEDVWVLEGGNKSGAVLSEQSFRKAFAEFKSNKAYKLTRNDKDMKTFYRDLDKNTFIFRKHSIYAEGGGVNKFQIGDLVFNKSLGNSGLVGLVVSGPTRNEEYETNEYDVLYRGYGGDIIPTDENEIVDITEGYMDVAENKSDVSMYSSIAQKRGITLNPVYQEILDGGEEFATGGYVGKGELVWRKLTSSQKAEFLYENFTPEITPRGQELLVGKAYNFLPKNVKIKLNSKYANVEEYAQGGGVGRKISKANQEKLSNLMYRLESADRGWIKNNPEKFQAMKDEYNALYKKLHGKDVPEITRVGFATGGGVGDENIERYYAEGKYTDGGDYFEEFKTKDELVTTIATLSPDEFDMPTIKGYGEKTDGETVQVYPKAFANGGSVSESDVEDLSNGYKEAILFTNEEQLNEEDPDNTGHTIHDFNPKSDAIIKKMAKQYIIDNQSVIEESGLDYEQIGRDIWYTQAGHGVGFFDRNLESDIEEKLIKGAKKFGDLSQNVFAQDGKVYIEGMKFADGGGVGEKLYYVVGKKKGQLVDISELPMTKEDAERWIKEQGLERYYDFNTVHIIPYHGTKSRHKLNRYATGGGVGDEATPKIVYNFPPILFKIKSKEEGKEIHKQALKLVGGSNFSIKQLGDTDEYWAENEKAFLVLKEMHKDTDTYAKGGSVAKISNIAKDITKIEHLVDYSIRGNSHQIPYDHRMIEDHMMFLNDKDFLTKYADKIGVGVPDEDEFDENGQMEEFRITDQYFITFKDDSEITLDFNVDGDFMNAYSRNAEGDEVYGDDDSMAGKYNSDFENDRWDIDITELETRIKSGKLAKGGNIPQGASGRYLELIPQKNGLMVKLTPEGKEELEAHEVEGEQVYLGTFINDLMDDIQGNSEYRYYTNLGEAGLGMTDAPGFTDGYFYNDEGELESHPDAHLYYYNDYAIKDEGREILEKGEVFFAEHKEYAKGGSIKDKRDIPHNEVLDYADELGLSTETEGDFDEVRDKLWEKKYAKESKKVGGRGFFGLKKGKKITDVKELSKGDIILGHSNQFNADNTFKIVGKRQYGDEVVFDKIYFNPKTNKRIGSEEMSLKQYNFDIGREDFYFPAKTGKKKK